MPMAVQTKYDSRRKAHASCVSHFAVLFDCRKAMLDAGQPGELPLMRELSSLKRARSLRDPSAGSRLRSPVVGNSSSSWKSPFVASPRLNREAESASVQGTAGLQYRHLQENDSKRILRQGPRLRTRVTPWTESIHSSDPRKNWDEADVNPIRGQEPLLRPHQAAVKSVASKAEVGQRKYTLTGYGQSSLLRNWDTESSYGPAPSEPSQRWPQRQSRSLDYSSRRGYSANSRAAVYDYETEMQARQQVLKEQAERMRGQKKNFQRANAPKHHSVVLSPLVLNSLDDINHHGHSLSLFSLEGPCHDTHNRGMKTRPKHVGSFSHSPHFLKLLIRPGQREAVDTVWRPPQTVTSSTSTRSTSQGTASQSSVAGMWDVTQLEDELDVCELPTNGCGIPCYWSKSQKRGRSLLDIAGRSLSRGFNSDSPRRTDFLSTTLGELPAHPSNVPIPRLDLEALPLLSDQSGATDNSADETGDLIGELGLNAANSPNVQQPVPSGTPKKGPEGKELAVYVERPRSLSQKYRPKTLEELAGQNLVSNALSNAVQKGKIAPVYLFQGSRGTGKTSAARILAASLNCTTIEKTKPCGACPECLALASGKSLDVREVDAASNNGVEKVQALIRNAFSAPSSSRYKVFIVDECHELTNETWHALLKLLEEPPGNVVFILITTDPDKLPSTAVSRCQKFIFPKITEPDIVTRLQALAMLENLDVEQGALEIIASRSDGSLRDAETMLDQLSLFGQKITRSTVHELVGSVSDEKLLSLLDLALCSDTVNTVQRARELIDSGVDPLDLMSQLATLITDILAGNNELMNKQEGGFFSRDSLSEEELERLRLALRILSDAEKQLRAAASDRTTWLTAALLQFGPARPLTLSVSSSGNSATASPLSRNPNGRRILGPINGKDNSHRSLSKGNSHKVILKGRPPSKSSFDVQVQRKDQPSVPGSNIMGMKESPVFRQHTEKQATFVGPGNLGNIWSAALERCKSIPLRQLLQNHGKLLALSISAVEAVVYLEFENGDDKSRAESLKKSISNAFQTALGLSVEVKISLASLPAGLGTQGSSLCPSAGQKDAKILVDFKQDAHSATLDSRFHQKGSLHYWRSCSWTASPRLDGKTSPAYRFSAFPNQPHPAGPDAHLTIQSPRHVSYFRGSVLPRTGTPLFEEARLGNEASQNPWCQYDGSSQEIVVVKEFECSESRQMRHVHSTFHGCNGSTNIISYDLEQENLRLESQSKYGGLLCWKGSRAEEEKVAKQHRQSRCAILMRLVPCAKSRS